MTDKKIKSQIFKTNDFFVENKSDKKMYLQRKSEFIFNKIATAIEKQKILEEKEKIKKKRSINQRESRKAKRKYYYEFYLFDNDFDYKKIDKDQLPVDFILKKNDFSLFSENRGVFRGSEITLISFLNSLYSIKNL